MKCRICGHDSRLVYKDLFDDRHGYPGKFSEYRCSNCGFIQIDPMLASSEIGEIYKKYYPISSLNIQNVNKFTKTPGRVMRWLYGKNNLPHYYVEGRNKKVLDYGCSSGKHMLKINKIHDVEGIDPDVKAGIEGKKNGLKIHTGFARDIPTGKTYDYILLAQVFEHDPYPDKLLNDLSKHLKPHGEIIMAFPHADSIYRKLFGRKWIHWHVPYHINLFTKKSIDHLVSNTMLRVKTFKTITPSDWPTLQFYRLFSKVKEGYSDVVWGRTSKNTKTIAISSLGKLMLGLGKLNLQAIPNRVFDLLGMGDCCLIILQKK